MENWAALINVDIWWMIERNEKFVYWLLFTYLVLYAEHAFHRNHIAFVIAYFFFFFFFAYIALKFIIEGPKFVARTESITLYFRNNNIHMYVRKIMYVKQPSWYFGIWLQLHICLICTYNYIQYWYNMKINWIRVKQYIHMHILFYVHKHIIDT